MYIYQVEREILRKKISEHRGVFRGRILDAGSGPSKRFKDLASSDAEYLSLDINPEYKTDIVGSVDAIPVEDSSFDFIVCSQVLGDLLYPGKAVEEFYRVLKNGGKILITEGFMNELHGEPRDYWRFTPYGISELLKDKGFEIVQLETAGGFFTVGCQMLTRFAINSFSLYDFDVLGKIFSKAFLVLGKMSIALDYLFQGKANRKFGLSVVALAEAVKKHG